MHSLCLVPLAWLDSYWWTISWGASLDGYFLIAPVTVLPSFRRLLDASINIAAIVPAV